ncbi:hypothetical protein HN709_05130 [Candidatus Peregrinibacteria bacterium]|jgi:hypothetical protein|nr:hypothetical protein [Candidatus Peregrinibacteria bacterium]MBT7737044.1 hypothetical protein [Candidatus Peregrinibacteria bacterium]
MFKFSKILGLLTLAVSVFLASSLIVFAEDDGQDNCSGLIVGKAISLNTNAGVTNFDSHPDSKGSSGVAVGKILGLGNIIAPGEQAAAACVEISEDGYLTDDDGLPTPDDDVFDIKGYVWNENLGFINFYCGDDGFDIGGTGNACGSNPYGVTLGAADVNGDRILEGEAWNPVFGYVYFNILNDPDVGGVCMGSCDLASGAASDEDKKVYRDELGNLHGYAWTDAGVWIGFSGVNMGLPGEPVPPPPGDCGQTPAPMVCALMDPAILVDEDPVLADGEDSYNIELYLHANDGEEKVTIDDARFTAFELTFYWKDTVKKDQRVDAPDKDASFDDLESPWEYKDGSNGGGVLFKPHVISKADFDTYFDEVSGKTGVYELLPEKRIKSFAPTTNANISLTTSTDPAYSVNNSVFLTNALDGEQPVPNNLILESIGYELTFDGVDYSGTIHPNGKASIPLKFAPAVNVDTLYANGFQDMIEVSRSVPINFALAVSKAASLDVSTDPDFDFILTLDEDEESACGANFSFNYHTPASEEAEATGTEGNFVIDEVPGVLYAIATISGNACQAGNDCTIWDELGGYSDKLDCEEDVANCTNAACSYAGNAGIHSVIHYEVDGDRDVYYYGNKLPRTASSLVNPVAVIHGNIYAPKAFSPSAEQKTQATGNVSVNVVRNSVNENVKKIIEKNTDVTGLTPNGGTCTITNLKPNAVVVNGNDCTKNGDYAIGEVSQDGEIHNYIYFKGISDDLVVEINLSELDKNWTVITEGAQVKMIDDIYSTDEETRFSLVAMRKEGGVCADSNIYIDKNVKNIQANIAADCSVFSFDYNNENNPDPILSTEGIDDGLPYWPGGAQEMAEELDQQLFIEGSVASRNTIGGADLDAEGLLYLLLGTGETVGLSQAERLWAQAYDLNYLRLFKLKLELSADGLPVDQICQKGLTIDDMIAINDKKAYVATLDGIFAGMAIQESTGDHAGVWHNGVQCDGINPLNMFGPGQDTCYGDAAGPLDCSGDLTVLNEDASKLSQGLDPNADFEPVYIFYKPPNSFVFEKSGKTTTF